MYGIFATISTKQGLGMFSVTVFCCRYPSVVQCGMAADAGADALGPLPVSLFERPVIESSATKSTWRRSVP